jgi:hypothetical protein
MPLCGEIVVSAAKSAAAIILLNHGKEPVEPEVTEDEVEEDEVEENEEEEEDEEEGQDDDEGDAELQHARRPEKRPGPSLIMLSGSEDTDDDGDPFGYSSEEDGGGDEEEEVKLGQTVVVHNADNPNHSMFNLVLVTEKHVGGLWSGQYLGCRQHPLKGPYRKAWAARNGEELQQNERPAGNCSALTEEFWKAEALAVINLDVLGNLTAACVDVITESLPAASVIKKQFKSLLTTLPSYSSSSSSSSSASSPSVSSSSSSSSASSSSPPSASSSSSFSAVGAKRKTPVSDVDSESEPTDKGGFAWRNWKSTQLKKTGLDSYAAWDAAILAQAKFLPSKRPRN